MNNKVNTELNSQMITHFNNKQRKPATASLTKSNLSVAIAMCLTSLTATLPMQSYAETAVVKNNDSNNSENRRQTYNIAAGALTDALLRFAAQAKITLQFDTKLTENLKTSGFQGEYSIKNGLTTLLRGSTLSLEKVSASVYTLKKSNSQAVVGTLALTQVTSGERFGDAPQEQGGFKAEYQSTTSKMAMRIIDTPQAISAITRDALDARLVKSLATAVELTPSTSSGLMATAGGSPDMFGGYGRTSSIFAIRGQEADIRTDGFKNASYYNDDDGLDIAAFERIEVIRGPAGFYGSGSLGGFINKVRKKPQADFGANLSMQAGSYNTYRAEAGITGSMNQDETLRGRVDFAYENTDAFTDNIENERIFVAPSVESIVSDNTRILVQLIYQKDEFDANPGVPVQVDGELYEQFSSRTELYGTSGDKSSKENTIARLTVEHELSERWLASLYLQGQKLSREFVNGNFASVYSGNVYQSELKDHNDAENWAGELRLQGSFDAFEREHKILFGIESNQQKVSRSWGMEYNYISLVEDYEGNIGDFPSTPAVDIGTKWDVDNKSTNHAIYGQIFLNILDNTKLSVATRYDVAKTDNRANYYTTEETKDSAWTSRLGLIQAISDNIKAYVTYGQSFSPANELGREGALEPTTGVGYELGLKTNWFDNKLASNLSVYQQELDNRPITDPTNSRDDSFSISSGKHLTKGIELDINGSPYPGWTIGGAASLMDNEFTEKGDPYYGLSVEGTFDKQASIYSSYQVQNGKLKGLGIGATFIHLSAINNINHSVTPNLQVYLDGYNRLDLNLSYQGIVNWDINLLVRNVTDENYLISSNTSVGNWGAPRSVLLQATYNFD